MARTRHPRALTLLGVLLVAAGTFGIVRYVLFPPGDIPRGAIVVPRDAATLDIALRRVEPGGTIALDTRGEVLVGPFVIDIPEITIRSFGGPAQVSATGSAPAVAIHANDVTLRNIHVAAEGVGVSVTGARCRVEDLVVRDTPVGIRLSGARDCSLSRIDVTGGDVAVDLSSSGGTEVRGLTVRGAAEAGVRATASWGTTIEHLAVEGARFGLSLADGTRETVLRDGVLDTCGDAGIAIRSSADITLVGCVVRDTPVGVSLDQATGCEIRGSTIQRSSVAGISLARSVQNSVQGNVVRAVEGSGLRLSESAENSLSGNEIRGDPVVAIGLTASNQNLILHNEIGGGAIGIRVDDSEACRILRNEVDCRDIGIMLTGGEANHLLDNRVVGGAFGTAVVSSSANAILRNQARGQTESAFSLVGTQSTALTENLAAGSGIGILIADSSAIDVLNNKTIKNDVGVLLISPGPGLRLEGNRIAQNRIGLRQAEPSGAPARLDLLGAALETGVGTASPILANNAFSENRQLDVENAAAPTLFAADNQWAGTATAKTAGARVSSGVNLEESAWKGVVAIGTEDDDLQAILGHILAISLTRAGYCVVDLIGLGDTELVRDAIQNGDVDLITFESSREPTTEVSVDVTAFVVPARAGWVAVVPQAIADRLPQRTLTALAATLDAGQSLLWAVPQTAGEPIAAALRDTYGLGPQVRAIVWATSLDEAESLLTFGAAEFGILDSLEETVTLSGFVSLEDDRRVLPSRSVVALVRSEVLARHEDVEAALSLVLPRLTAAALRDLTSRVRLLGQSPKDVAMEFLAQEVGIGD